MSNEMLGLLGLLIALAGFLVNVHYRRKQDQRDEREHEKRMRKLATAPGELQE